MITCAKLSVLFSLVAALVVALPASTVLAEPFVYVTMKARVLNGNTANPEDPLNTRPFTTGYLGVTGGQMVQYQLFVQMATPVKTNSSVGNPNGLASATFGLDGVLSAKFHMWEDPLALIQATFQPTSSTGAPGPFKWDNQMTTPQPASRFYRWSEGITTNAGTRVLRSGTNYDIRNFAFMCQYQTPFLAGIAGVYSYVVEDEETGELVTVNVDVPAQSLLGYGRLRVAAVIGSGDSEIQMGYRSLPAPWWPGNEATPYSGDPTYTVLGAKINSGEKNLTSPANDSDPYIGFNTVTLYNWAAPEANAGTQTVPDPDHP
jgi:hypothetical protein